MASRYFVKKRTIKIKCPRCKNERFDRFRLEIDPKYAVLLELTCSDCLQPEEIRCPVYRNKAGKSVY